jgi:hypothetical protein
MYIPTYMVIPLWIFALFGIVCLFMRILGGIRWRGSNGTGKYSIIISARNQQETLEGLIRGFIIKAGLDGKEEALFDVVLVDAGSSDDTPKVMKNLAEEYCFIKLIPPGELSIYLTDLMNK